MEGIRKWEGYRRIWKRRNYNQNILYEKLIESATSTEDYLKNLYDFMEDMDDRYNQTIDADQISALCRLAKQ